MATTRVLSRRAYVVREILEFLLLIGALGLAEGFTSVPPWLWVGLPVGKVLTSSLFYMLFLRQSFRTRPTHALEHWVGRTAATVTMLDPEGAVRIDGEIWAAQCEGGTISADRRVVVQRIEGRRLIVQPPQTGDKTRVVSSH